MSQEVRLRHIAQVNPQSPRFNRLSSDAELTFLPMEAVWPGERLDRSRVRVKNSVVTGFTRFQDGDVLVPKITPTFEASRSVLVDGLVNGAGAGTTELHVLRPRGECDARYLTYVTHSEPFLKLGESQMYGVAGQQRVPDDFIRDYAVQLPAVEEQRRIADFLDAETARIDAVIEKRRRQAALLTERAKVSLDAMMGSQTASRELRLSRLVDPSRPIQYGIVLPGPDYPGGVPIIKGGDIAGDRLALQSVKRTDPAIDAQYPRSRVHEGDLVIAIRGSVGEVARVPGELGGANLTQDSARIAPLGVDLNWLALVLITSTVQDRIKSMITGATITGINIMDLRRVAIPTPVPERQIELGRRGRRLNDVARDVTSALTRGVHLLAERRQALITAAVTGQLDVTTARGTDV